MPETFRPSGGRSVMERSDAIRLGLRWYFTGRPCLRGHAARRLVSNSSCDECANQRKAERDRAFYAANCEKIKARVRNRWKSSPEARALDKACRDHKREKIRAYDRMRAKRDRAKKDVILARWKAKNPERARVLGVVLAQRRRARKKSAGGTIFVQDIQKAFNAQRGTCWWCSCRLRTGYHVDHRIPLAKGGSNAANNIVISCAPCNRAKSAKMPWEFAGRLL